MGGYNAAMGRYLVLSDIHANIEALNAVLEWAEGRYDRILVLGDLVDYGPNPNEVIALIRKLGAQCIRGNHDAVVVGEHDIRTFREEWQPVARWTMNRLSPESQSFLQSLPTNLEVDGALLVHANIFDYLNGYILTSHAAEANLKESRYQLVFFGHTHIGIVYSREEKRGTLTEWEPNHLEELTLRPGVKYLVNPGSVGQPRNHDPRSFACIWNSQAKTIVFLRVTYDFRETQRKIREAGLPEALAARLEVGR